MAPLRLNDATKTARWPEVTGCPACVMSPPNKRAVPAGGFSTNVGALTLRRNHGGASAIVAGARTSMGMSLSAAYQNAVPPPSNALGLVSVTRTVKACRSLCGLKSPPCVYTLTAGSLCVKVKL